MDICNYRLASLPKTSNKIIYIYRELQCIGEDLLLATPVCTPLSQHYDYALDKPPTILFRHQSGKLLYISTMFSILLIKNADTKISNQNKY